MRKRIGLIFCGATLLALAYGTSLCLPLYINHLGGNEINTGYLFGMFGLGTIVAVISSSWLLKRIASKTILVAASLFYALGMLLFAITIRLNLIIYPAGILAGIGWGLYYNAAPFALSYMSTKKDRSVIFSYLSAFNVIGGASTPILVKIIWGHAINYKLLFAGAIAACILAALTFLLLTKTGATTNTVQRTKTKHKLNLLKEKVKYPIIMSLLGACAFTLMTNFQTTFANSMHLNYAYFFAVYAGAIVLARFLASKALARLNQFKVAIILLIMMITALTGFLFVRGNISIYIIMAALFGVGYGLAYPTIQAIAVNMTSPQYRSEIISCFSLAYFIGVYAFPVAAGWIVVHFGYQTVILVAIALVVLELLLCKKVSSLISDDIIL